MHTHGHLLISLANLKFCKKNLATLGADALNSMILCWCWSTVSKQGCGRGQNRVVLEQGNRVRFRVRISFGRNQGQYCS